MRLVCIFVLCIFTTTADIGTETCSSAYDVSTASTLLNSNHTMPTIAFGTRNAKGEKLKQALAHALSVGYRHIDTAGWFGNEEVIGDVIKESGIPRKDLFISTKLSSNQHGRKNTLHAIHESLRKLKTHYIDLYLIGTPFNHLSLANAEDARELRRQTWIAMMDMKAAGQLKSIGVANFYPAQISQMSENDYRHDRRTSVVPAVNQIEFHAFLFQPNLIAYCERLDIKLVVYGSINAKGLLSNPTLKRIAERHGKTVAQVSLRYALQKGFTVLAKSVTPARIEENADVFDFQLTEDEMNQIKGLARNQRDYLSHYPQEFLEEADGGYSRALNPSFNDLS